MPHQDRWLKIGNYWKRNVKTSLKVEWRRRIEAIFKAIVSIVVFVGLHNFDQGFSSSALYKWFIALEHFYCSGDKAANNCELYRIGGWCTKKTTNPTGNKLSYKLMSGVLQPNFNSVFPNAKMSFPLFRKFTPAKLQFSTPKGQRNSFCWVYFRETLNRTDLKVICVKRIFHQTQSKSSESASN